MAIDLNDAPRYGRFDRDVVSAALRLNAQKWVPKVFPNGRREHEAGEQCWRCANIKGDRPGKQGSCRIWLTGEHAGDWYDFEENKGGQVLSTIKAHFELPEGGTIPKAVEIIEEYGGSLDDAVAVYTNGHAKPNGDARADRAAAAALNYYLNSVSCVGTIAETYWQARHLGNLPPCAFGSYDDSGPDMTFNEFATNWDLGGKGVPSIVHRFRYPDGSLTGAMHLTHLLPDGSYHLGKGVGKKTWGSRINGGVIMLAPINAAGELGIGEGIESTAAGMILFNGIPGWASCGTAAMRKFGEWIAAGNMTTPPIKRLLLWGDAGKGGERTLFETAALCRTRIAAVETYLPRSGDDMAADLAQGLGQPPQALDAAPGLPIGPQPGQPAAIVPAGPASEVASRLMALSKASPPAEVSALCALIASAGLPDIERESAINNIYRKTGISKKTVTETVRKLSAEIILPETTYDKAPGKRPWGSKFALGNDGDPKGIMSNVAIVLREAEEIKGAFALNDFEGAIHILRKLPWEQGAGNPCQDRRATDHDELATLEWMQGTAGVHATRGVVFDAIQRVAAENIYHPVKEYLHDAHERWDGRARLDMLSVLYFGAKDTQYNREVMKRWMISAVARVLNPGVKADCMMVLEGPQGLGKSTALRVLFDPNNSGWFTDNLSEMGTKDASIELHGIWCAEYSELEGMSNPQSRTIKNYMSRTFDRFRPPYGRFMVRVERQNVFAGTTNEYEYGKDATGARRFWPLRCTKIDRDGLIRDVDLIWGEAVDLYLNHHNTWWIDEQKEPELAAEAARIADARYVSDAWDAVVRRWLQHNGRVNVTTDEVLRDALEIGDKAKWSRSDQTRVGYILRRMKWIRARDRNSPREWRYWRPGTLNPAIAEAEED